MADDQHDFADNGGAGSGQSGEPAATVAASQASPQEERPSTLASRLQQSENFGPGNLQRAGSMPYRRHESNFPSEDENTGGRRRGRTISSRPRNSDAPPLSPRAQMLRRQISNNNGGNESRSPLPDVREGEVSRPRASTVSSRPRFSSSGMRPRMGTWASPNRPRGSTVTQRPSVALGVEATATGRAQENQSVANFSLAGQAVDAVTANQP